MCIQENRLRLAAAMFVVVGILAAGCASSPATDLLTYRTSPGAASLGTKLEGSFNGSSTSCVTVDEGELQYVVAFPEGSKWQDGVVVLPDGHTVEMGKPITFSGGEMGKESFDRLNVVPNCSIEGANVWVFEPIDS